MTAARKIVLSGLISLVALLFGCEKSSTATSVSSSNSISSATSASNATAPTTLLRLHWTGRRNISSDTNSLDVMRLWKMPESVRLEAQTLDTLSAAPWRFLRNETNKSSARLLRPLLEDVIEEETYINVLRSDTDSPAEMVLAVHLNDPRAAVWQTNLSTILESLTGIAPTNSQTPGQPSRWILKKHHVPNLIEFTHAGGWMLLGAAEDTNALFDAALDRLQHNQSPADAPSDNSWLEAQADLSRCAGAFGTYNPNFPADLPAITLSIKGENQKVRTVAHLTFPGQNELPLSSWNIPTNLISPELASFTAVRGISQTLGAQPFWENLQAGNAPDQLFVWALPESPSQTYFATPCADASNVVAKIADRAFDKNSSLFSAAHLVGSLKPRTSDGIQWYGLPMMSPFLKSTNSDGNGFIFGGLFQPASAKSAPPPTLFAQLNQTNLVGYDWEMTGIRIPQLLYVGQLARIGAGKAQLPSDSLSLAWLMAAARWGGFSATTLTQTGPGQFTINRKSSFGFTALEMHLLADWLESPDFPFGLHTLRAKPNSPSPTQK